MPDVKFEKYLGKLLLIGLTLVTTTVFSTGVTDPVNVTKLFIVGGVAFSSLAILTFQHLKYFLDEHRLLIVVILLFLAASLNSIFRSGAPLIQSIYGAYGRNNGFLLYLCLTFILLATLIMQSVKTFQFILRALYISGIINVVYCSWVISFGDFIGWSNPYGNILGTLGNPNFIGSFFGIFATVVMTRIFAGDKTLQVRVFDLLLLLVTIFLIFKSHAVQGRVLFMVGLFINLFFWLRHRFKSYFPLAIFSIGSAIFGILAVLGTLQKGPLTSYLYKDSVSLRGQYWYAGIKMGMEHPFTGVGFDAYGDWYRSVRRPSALIRPGIEVTSNAAHNVFIDLFAFGGFPLFLSYLGMLIIVLRAIYSQARKSKKFDPIFVSLVGAWSCYVLQSIISINQIGLAIWGWCLSGSLIAYNKKLDHSTRSSKPRKDLGIKSQKSINVLSPGLRGGLGIVLGFLIAIPPLSGDMKWRAAQLSRDALLVEQSLKPGYMNPQNSFRYVTTVGVFIESKLPDSAHKYAIEATKFNPRSYESWRLFSFITSATTDEKIFALKKMKLLDPLNPAIREIAK